MLCPICVVKLWLLQIEPIYVFFICFGIFQVVNLWLVHILFIIYCVPNPRFLQPTESNRQQLNCLERQPHLVTNTVSCPPLCFSNPIFSYPLTKTQTPKPPHSLLLKYSILPQLFLTCLLPLASFTFPHYFHLLLKLKNRLPDSSGSKKVCWGDSPLSILTHLFVPWWGQFVVLSLLSSDCLPSY